jgi:hypothetical protein
MPVRSDRHDNERESLAQGPDANDRELTSAMQTYAARMGRF